LYVYCSIHSILAWSRRWLWWLRCPRSLVLLWLCILLLLSMVIWR